MKPLRVGIIGLGRIACGYDRPDGPTVQTHIKACLADPRLDLAYISDSDLIRARTVKQEWNLSAEIVTPKDFFARDIDIACVSTPSETHLAMLANAADHPPRLILCEKPIGRDPNVAQAAVLRTEQAGSTIAVNMLRRWIPGLTKWKDLARSGKLGCPVGANVIYSGGFWNNGAHAVDLLSAFFGEETTEARRWGPRIADRSAQDPTISLFAACGDAPLWMRGVDGRTQTVFTVELMFERARIWIGDEDGIKARLDLPAALDTPGYAPELRVAERFHDKPATLMTRVWSNLADHLLNGAPVACTAAAALAGLRMQARLAHCMEEIEQ